MAHSSKTPSLSELKRLCFKQNINPSLKERYKNSPSIYYALYVTHFFSIRIVRLLYNTRITPNQVTLASIAAVFLGAFLFSCGDRALSFMGALLFEVFYILDAVDGQLARAKSLSSPGGRYLDEFLNYLAAPLILFGIGIGILRHGFSLTIFSSIWLACYAVIIIQVIELLRSHVVFERQGKSGNDIVQSENDRRRKDNPGLLKTAYSLFYRSCTMPVLMNIITTASIINLLVKYEVFKYIIIYFASVGTAVWVLKLIHISRGNIISKDIDSKIKIKG